MANYTMRADGTAASLAACTDGDPAVISECMDVATHNSLMGSIAAGSVIQLADTGGVYRAILQPANGSSGNNIVYEAYSGDTPILSGSDLIGDIWSTSGGNLWETTASITTAPMQVFIDGQFGDRKTSSGACVNEYDWYWASNVLYLYATGDPYTEYTTPGVEAGQRDYCVFDESNTFFTLDGLTAVHSQVVGLRATYCDEVVMKNCIVEWNYRWGIQFRETDDCVAEDNIARYNGENGVAFHQHMDGARCLRNKCYGNNKYQSYEIDSNLRWRAGIRIYPSEQTATDVLVKDNECYDNGYSGSLSGQGVGIWLDGNYNATSDITISENYCHDNYGQGLYLEISRNTDCFDNVVINNGLSSATNNGNVEIRTWGVYIAENVNFHNNTCVGGYYGLDCHTQDEEAACRFQNNSIRNNIITGASSGINLLVFAGAGNTGSYGSGNVYRTNCFGAEDTAFISWNGTTYNTYDAWLAASSQADDNVEADPVFTDAGGDDYSHDSSSPCVGAAANLGSPFNQGLLPASTWTDGVVTGDRDSY